MKAQVKVYLNPMSEPIVQLSVTNFHFVKPCFVGVNGALVWVPGTGGLDMGRGVVVWGPWAMGWGACHGRSDMGGVGLYGTFQTLLGSLLEEKQVSDVSLRVNKPNCLQG